MYFEVYRDRANEWRWRGKAHNHVIIADSSEGYTTKAGCLRALNIVKTEAADARVDELD